jgi:hypothetical protein
VFGVEVAEVVVIEDIGQAPFKKTEATVIPPQDVHYPAGRSFTSEPGTTWMKL